MNQLKSNFSVVAPCFNEEAHIGNLLEDLRRQTELPQQVVVADCASDDNTVEVAKNFIHKLPLQIVRSPRRSPAAARNSGVAVVDCHPNDYLVFVDADMRLPTTFLADTRTVVQEHPVDFITPAFLSDGKHLVDTLSIKSINARNRRIISQSNKVAGIGGVMVVRKAVHDKTGGFPENVAQDDMAYVDQLNKHRATAYFAGNIRVVNSSRRLQEEGTLRWLLGVLPEDAITTRAISRLLGHDVSKRAYGHYKPGD
ncbi:MAG TPA: glycosyltransferase [Candidatus Saccharimonadales bacterium]|jgi:glycosyltransferase involved in cell wall biosynthesis